MTWNLFLDDEHETFDVTWASWQIREKYRDEDSDTTVGKLK